MKLTKSTVKAGIFVVAYEIAKGIFAEKARNLSNVSVSVATLLLVSIPSISLQGMKRKRQQN